MFPSIPQEVIDLCIDNLSFSITDSDPTCPAWKALLRCSLVSHAFGQRARHHIFSYVVIKPSPEDIRSQRFRDIMKEDLNICQFIRTLEIHIVDKLEGDDETATSETGLPDILNMVSPSSGGQGINGFKLYGTLNSWSRVHKDFQLALFGLIHNIKETSTSVRGGEFKTLKSIHISGFKEVPVALITNCSYTIKNMSIQYLSFIDAPDGVKSQASNLAPSKKEQGLATESPAHSPLVLRPNFVLEKFHFSGNMNGNIDSLATALMREPFPFSGLEELVTYPRCPGDLAFVWRVLRVASKSLRVFKLYAITLLTMSERLKDTVCSTLLVRLAWVVVEGLDIQGKLT